mmetsp:Transcript_13883/g.39881  ORF Transcript_13883/g.39881 Transcript_13883/m.39881 type:complete len:337 (-) Transcript_13883:100-1110(-)
MRRRFLLLLQLFVVSSSCLLLAASGEGCDDKVPPRFRGDCESFRTRGHCVRNTQNGCKITCGDCLSSKDEKAVKSVMQSYCLRKGGTGVSEDVLRDLMKSVRSARAGRKLVNASIEVEDADLLSVLENPDVHEVVRKVDLECLSKTTGLKLFLEALDLRTSIKPELQVNLAQVLSDYYKDGCNTEQLLGFLPQLVKLVRALVRDGRYVQESGLLLDIYSIEYPYQGTSTKYTERTIDDYPAISQCLSGKSLKTILSVRECHDEEYGGQPCHRGSKSLDPLTLPFTMLYTPPPKAKAESEEESEGRERSRRISSRNNLSRRRSSERSYWDFANFEFP